MTTAGDTMAHGVALRLRALAATRWIDRSDEATREALTEGAAEVERLARELADAEAVARGAQYREREALGEVAVLRARLDARADDVERLNLALSFARCGEQEAVGDVARLQARLDAWARAGRERVGATQPTGDLAALARREAGPVTRRQWRQCRRCVRCFWLTPDEAVPEHQAQVMGAERVCGWTVTAKESE